MASRPNHFGRFICLSFFCGHNNAKSILISNPNGHEIKDEHEVAAISSYPEEHLDVQVYHTRDYLQFDDTFCSSGSLIALRALYNTDRDRLNKALKNGQQKNMGHTNFDYTSIKLGDSILQKKIGIVPQNRDEQKRLAQVLREEFLNLGQVQQNRKGKLGKLVESLQPEISQSTASPPAIPVGLQTEELDLSKEEVLTENLFLTYMLLIISCEFYRGYNKC